MRNRSVLTPILVGAALILVITIIARTDVFKPLIQFLHTGEITPLEAVWCLLAAIPPFILTLKLLIMLGGYFLPETDQQKVDQRKCEDNERKNL